MTGSELMAEGSWPELSVQVTVAEWLEPTATAGELTLSCRPLERDLVVVERDGGAGAGDGLGKVVAHGGIELGLGRGVMAVADVDESERRAEEAADESEAGAAGLLGGSVGVVYMIGDRAHDVAALPESANDGADFAGETTEDALFDDTHDCKRLRC